MKEGVRLWDSFKVKDVNLFGTVIINPKQFPAFFSKQYEIFHHSLSLPVESVNARHIFQRYMPMFHHLRFRYSLAPHTATAFL